MRTKNTLSLQVPLGQMPKLVQCAAANEWVCVRCLKCGCDLWCVLRIAHSTHTRTSHVLCAAAGKRVCVLGACFAYSTCGVCYKDNTRTRHMSCARLQASTCVYKVPVVCIRPVVCVTRVAHSTHTHTHTRHMSCARLQASVCTRCLMCGCDLWCVSQG